VQQCEWVPATQRCLLGSEFTTRTLADTSAAPDPFARFVSKSLGCARTKTAAACNADPACAWDGAFADGQEGCFLSDAQHLAVAQSCVQPRYSRALAALQGCMAQRRSCQCTDAASCARMASSPNGVCQPLLGCWLAKLQGQPFNVLQLAEAQMLHVGPLLASLAPNSTAAALTGAGRRRLLQPMGLNSPVYDDANKGGGKKKPAAAVPAAAAPAVRKSQDAGGQNKPILSDNAAATGGRGAEKGKLESASLYDAGIIQAEITAPTATSSSSGTPAPTGDGEALAYAPPSFWKCLADAAVRADKGMDWGGIDYNNKKLTLDTWLAAINKLVSWGRLGVNCERGETDGRWKLSQVQCDG